MNGSLGGNDEDPTGSKVRATAKPAKFGKDAIV
jgi:hypothetical protein